MDFEQRARAVLPPYVSAYYAAPASSEVDLDEGTVEWSTIRFRHAFVATFAPLNLATTVLVTPVRTPVLVAPMALQVGAPRWRGSDGARCGSKRLQGFRQAEPAVLAQEPCACQLDSPTSRPQLGLPGLPAIRRSTSRRSAGCEP